ncbi:MAG: hypothetical protein V1743_06695 [Nanoarchaeota archaeon]
MKTLLVMQDEFAEVESLALNIGRTLAADKALKAKVNIIFCEGPDELLEHMEEAQRKEAGTDQEFLLLDVMEDAKEITFYEDLAKIPAHAIQSMHDFDINYLLSQIKDNENRTKLKVIGVPKKGDAGIIAEKIAQMILAG